MDSNTSLHIINTVDVLLICALKDEYDQVLEVTEGLMAPGWKQYSDSNGWIVADGSFATSSSNPLTIRATHASYMGREQVQAIASKLIHAHPAKCIAMSGICAGRRGKVALGDVIFAERLWSYDAGKINVEDGEQRFQGDPIQYRPLSAWVQRMQHVFMPPDTSWLKQRPALPLEHQEDWALLRVIDGSDPHQHPDFGKECPDWSEVLARLWKRKWLEKPLVITASGRERAEELQLLYPNGLPSPASFHIHVAPMATGAAVTEDANIFNRLADPMRKVLGIEMEASALGALGDIHDIPVLVAKGVSDFGDPFKDDRYRQFAARAAAECLIALLRDGVDLLPNRGANESLMVLLQDGVESLANRSAKATIVLESANLLSPVISDIPRDLINLLAEQYPDVRDARFVWQRAGGKVSEVENIPRPRDMWQRLWQSSIQGASARPEAILKAALEDLPANAILQNYLAALKTS